ncbi:aromatic aminobenezylarsenical efflux permease ArsG family transporter [Carboxylicivirga linearis]|uniref:Sulfite exporter TauE/SafE family protein n=1 Tax=Carboxylicivirga linearis TaxID=1628157 RepID=A0ABS5JZ62_9BACT|nr:aromatic aminobenezylarsenical efflux permease ArsG family transporter [Carboxylicivirga linearis]MBS2100188.1 sulfite exporter TauE/SafE family protein [Carboxylicivirga linearis]
MEEFLSGLYSNSSAPVWSALLLGLMTAISPCPLASNITAIGFISKDIENRNKVFINGLVYTLGRVFSYSLLAAILVFGADQIKIAGVFQQYGEKILGPALIIIGLVMLGVINLKLWGANGLTSRFQNKQKHSYTDAFLLGVLFALTFCPYSGVLFFGMLIPLTIESSAGMLLPPVFAIATGIPVVIFAWLLAYTVSGVGTLYNKIKTFEVWFRRVVAVTFVGIGIYYTIAVWI